MSSNDGKTQSIHSVVTSGIDAALAAAYASVQLAPRQKELLKDVADGIAAYVAEKVTADETDAPPPGFNAERHLRAQWENLDFAGAITAQRAFRQSLTAAWEASWPTLLAVARKIVGV